MPDQREIYRRLDALQTRMVQSEQKRVKALREQFEKTSRSRALQDPMAFIDDKRMLLDYTQKTLPHSRSIRWRSAHSSLQRLRPSSTR